MKSAKYCLKRLGGEKVTEYNGGNEFNKTTLYTPVGIAQ
jgi:hypothetical protein